MVQWSAWVISRSLSEMRIGQRKNQGSGVKAIKSLLLISFLMHGTVYAQDKLGELALSEPEEKRVIVRNPERSALIFVSEVADLEFESTRVIYGVRPRGASEWQLLLEPGRQIITVRAPGYQPIKTEVIIFQK